MKQELKALLARKPGHGRQCNRCGYCCASEPCPVAQAVLGLQKSSGACQALEWEEGKAVCGLAAHPAHYAPVRAAALGEERLRRGLLLMIGSGNGCDTIAKGEYQDVDYERALFAARDQPKAIAAFVAAAEDWAILEEVLAT